MKKFIFLGVALALVGGLDAFAKSWAESQIESRAEAEATGSSAVADIDSFPFLGKLLLSGTAGDIDLRMRNVAAQQSLRFSRVSITLEKVQLDRGRLFSGQAEVTSIDRGVITMGFSAADLGEAIKMPVEIADGRINVTVRGRTVSAVPEATTEGSLRLVVTGLPPVTVPIPRTRLVSCEVDKVVVDGGVLEASCTIEEIPPALLRAAQSAR